MTEEEVTKYAQAFFRKIAARTHKQSEMYEWLYQASTLEWEVEFLDVGKWKLSASPTINPGMGVWKFIEKTGEMIPQDETANQLIEVIECD